LSGARNYIASGTQNDSINGPFSFRKVIPFLGSGAVHCHTLKAGTNPSDDATNFVETNAKSNFQSVMILEKAVPTKLANIATLLQSTTDW
jgi:hypothetical protein